MIACPKCVWPTAWCLEHQACARDVRARWMHGRRSGFRDRVWLEGETEQPKGRETDSQFQARVRNARLTYAPWKTDPS